MARLSLFGLTSRENADFQFDPEDDEESGDTGGLVSEASNDLGSLRFDALLGGRATSRTIVSWYRNTELLAVDATFEASSRRSNAPDDATAAGSTNVVFDLDLSVRDLSVRQELAFPSRPRTPSTPGWSCTVSHRRPASPSPATGTRPSLIPPAHGAERAYPTTSIHPCAARAAAAWVQDRYTVTQWLSVEPALRLDWSTVPATTATAGEPGRRRSAAGASGRIAQFLPPGGRMSGRPIKRTLRGRASYGLRFFG